MTHHDEVPETTAEREGIVDQQGAALEAMDRENDAPNENAPEVETMARDEPAES